MRIQRLILVGDDKSTTVSMVKILTIPIKPGIPAGTEIVFPEEGDQGPSKIPGKSVHRLLDLPRLTAIAIIKRFPFLRSATRVLISPFRPLPREFHSNRESKRDALCVKKKSRVSIGTSFGEDEHPLSLSVSHPR